MKFIKGKLSLLYPLFLLLFYFYVRPQFRPLAQYVSNSVASANSYYWTLFGLEGLYAVFTGFLVYRFSKKAQFKLGKNPLQALIEAVLRPVWFTGWTTSSVVLSKDGQPF